MKEAQIEAMVRRIENNPGEFFDIMETLDERGFDQASIDEVARRAPQREGVDAIEFAEGLSQGLTLGFADTLPPNPQATQIDLPIIGETGLARGAGEVVGSAVPALAGAGVASVAARAAGVASRGGLLAARVIGGEGVPGLASGLIQSDGDLESGLEMAGLWMGSGLLLEGTASLAMRGLRKIRQADEAAPANVTHDEKAAMREVERVAEEEAAKVGGAENFTDLKVKWADAFKHNRPPPRFADAFKGNFPDRGRARFADAFKKGATAEEGSASYWAMLRSLDVPVAPLLDDQTIARVLQNDRGIYRGISTEAVPPEKIHPLVQRETIASNVTENVSSLMNLRLNLAHAVQQSRLNPEQALQALRRGLDGDINVDKFIGELNVKLPDNPDVPPVTRGSASSLEDPVAPDAPVETRAFSFSTVPYSQFHRRTQSDPFARTRLLQGLVGQPVEVRIKGERFPRVGILTQADDGLIEVLQGGELNFFSIEQTSSIGPATKLAARGGAFGQAPDPEARAPISNRQQHDLIVNHTSLMRTLDEELEGLRSRLRPEDLDELTLLRELDLDSVPAIQANVARDWITRIRNANGRLKNWRASKAEAEAFRTIRSPQQASSKPIERDWTLSGLWEHAKGGKAGSKISEDDSYRDVLFPWFSRLVPPTSRWGLGANSHSRKVVFQAQNMFRKVGRDTEELLQRYAKALDNLDPGIPQGNLSRVNRTEITRDKILLARALDGNAASILAANPKLVPAYSQLRQILDEMAERLGIDPQERITDYFPHLFDGQSGLWRAGRLANEIGPRGRWLIPSTAAGDVAQDAIPSERFFQFLQNRKGAEGFNYDLDAVFYAYLRGASQKLHMDPFLDSARGVMNQLRRQGDELADRGDRFLVADETKDYIDYIQGKPTKSRIATARFWRENDLFQDGVDSLIEWLGDPNLKGMLSRARKGRYAPGEDAQAIQFFDRLIRDANRYTREGDLNKVPGSKKLRAKLALQIDDIRFAMSNPNMHPFVISKLYEMMVVNKLGLSFSHGIINMTQTLTNTFPLIGAKYMAQGMKRYASNPDAVLKSGRTVREVLEESGVSSQTPEATEFISDQFGVWSSIRDGVMAPARFSEKFNRSVALLGSYEKHLVEDGLNHSQALAAAIELVDRTQFSFNRAATIPAMRNPFIRFLMMFKSYPLHQMNFSAELLQDAMKGDVGPFINHIMAYLALGGIGATALGGTSFGTKAAAPVFDFTNGVGLNDVAGPPAAALIDAMHGQLKGAYEEFTVPTAAKRAQRATESSSPIDAMLEASGFAR